MNSLTPLREIITFKGGGTPSKKVPDYWGGDIPWATVKDFTSTALVSTQDFITQKGLQNSSANMIPKGHVIIPTRMSLGKVAINRVDLAINQDLRALIPKNGIDTKYLLYAMLSLKEEIVKRGSGATVKGITQEELYKLKIPVPSLDDQIRIAHLLGKVEGLIAQRKESLQQLDELLKSIFLEMFGDPVRNEKGWATGSLSSYGSFKNGLNFGKGESGTTVRYLGVGDFKSKATLTDIDCLAFIELNALPSEEYFLREGDLLFVRSNGNRDLVGRCMAVYPGVEKVTYSGFCIRYRINDPTLQPTYIAHLFRSVAFRRILFQGGQGANIQNINQKTLSALPIPLPSKDLQNQFAAIVEKIEGLKSRYQKSLTDLESLYGALSHKAFRGEMDLSRVTLEHFSEEVGEVCNQ
ncbi:restriction endonuclease subunit S [Geoalkalibacter halelectricus]|uniref:Restriction endonuclease subunit S n=1 Tax=Geoalkalibacter halelectricus TaxID=2847045 RepID=A0ABY5ZUG2_9BACT|nr:restriction endonuclease subunit S [Geoalkalibacter halelectricus]MDO3377712.1 restriction endonuclease subunit S [Geoalkalibacter halelectricus]UWZ81500.1 restriction endonuclease subunit S [Geoalkalibacter halelectricus]